MRSGDKYTRKLFVECDCWAHAIELTKFHDEDEIYLSLWFMGHRGVPILKRLKAIWEIFIHGGGYLFEDLVLTRKNAQELKTYLEELLSDMPTKEEC